MKDKILVEVWRQVRDQVCDQVRIFVYDQVLDQVDQNVWDQGQVHDQVWWKIKANHVCEKVFGNFIFGDIK